MGAASPTHGCSSISCPIAAWRGWDADDISDGHIRTLKSLASLSFFFTRSLRVSEKLRLGKGKLRPAVPFLPSSPACAYTGERGPELSVLGPRPPAQARCWMEGTFFCCAPLIATYGQCLVGLLKNTPLPGWVDYPFWIRHHGLTLTSFNPVYSSISFFPFYLHSSCSLVFWFPDTFLGRLTSSHCSGIKYTKTRE